MQRPGMASKRRAFHLIVGAIFAVAVATPVSAESCAEPLKPMLRADLFFGRSIGSRLGVTDRLWQAYVDGELTPRFPGGFTVSDGKGQWREGRANMREASKIVVLVAPDSPDLRGRIAAAVDIYVKRFKQKSVGLIMQAVCAAF